MGELDECTTLQHFAKTGKNLKIIKKLLSSSGFGKGLNAFNLVIGLLNS